MEKKDGVDYVGTEKAAKFLQCSTRRVRTLLAQGRISGYKDGKNWQVQWPMQITFGKRAPLRKFTQQMRKDSE